ncbi:MAG TPA: hypothetical protein VFX50_04770 [Gemmatimonadales bacterium]|nr:hypothetical protein [Gemmatimonadales bacterium]
MAPISLQDLRRVSDALAALRGSAVVNAVMRSDLRQLRLELSDGTLAVVRIEDDETGRSRLEVDVIQRRPAATSQLEVRFESA